VRRHGRFGAYVSCSNYPACRYKPPKPVRDTGVRCPKDGGVIAERRGRFRPFYGCVNYPNCDFTLSARPIPEACPQCGNSYLLVRERKGGNVFACDKAGCGFEKPAGAVPELQDVFLPASQSSGPKTPGPKASVPKKAPARRRAAKLAVPAAAVSETESPARPKRAARKGPPRRRAS
jgi:DNA topoisomerase-1